MRHNDLNVLKKNSLHTEIRPAILHLCELYKNFKCVFALNILFSRKLDTHERRKSDQHKNCIYSQHE